MEVIFELVKGIMIFSFLSAILEQLISESTMQKYLRFFIGIMFCILLLKGVLAALKKQEFLKEMECLPLEYRQDDMEDMFLEQEEKRERKVTEEYKKQKEKNTKSQKSKLQETDQDVAKIEIPKIIIEGEEDGE